MSTRREAAGSPVRAARANLSADGSRRIYSFVALASVLFALAIQMQGAYPVSAGILFGLLTLKVQLGILVPVLLLLERRWRAIAAAAMAAAALILASAHVFGTQVWVDYLSLGVSSQAFAVTDGTGFFKGSCPLLS